MSLFLVTRCIVYYTVDVGADIPDQEIAHGSFRRKLRKWRFRFEERREGVAAVR